MTWLRKNILCTHVQTNILLYKYNTENQLRLVLRIVSFSKIYVCKYPYQTEKDSLTMPITSEAG